MQQLGLQNLPLSAVIVVLVLVEAEERSQAARGRPMGKRKRVVEEVIGRQKERGLPILYEALSSHAYTRCSVDPFWVVDKLITLPVYTSI
jgi:hypothetical protein